MMYVNIILLNMIALIPVISVTSAEQSCDARGLEDTVLSIRQTRGCPPPIIVPGSQGPQGPQGIPGNQGAQGAPGAAGAFFNTYGFYVDYNEAALATQSLDGGANNLVQFPTTAQQSNMSINGARTIVTVPSAGVYFVEYRVRAFTPNIATDGGVFNIVVNSGTVISESEGYQGIALTESQYDWVFGYAIVTTVAANATISIRFTPYNNGGIIQLSNLNQFLGAGTQTGAFASLILFRIA